MRSEVMDGCEITITERFDKPTPQNTLAHGFITFNGEKFAYREVAFTKREFKQACIVANSNGGTWDWDILLNNDEWLELPLDDWGLNLPMTVNDIEAEWQGMPEFIQEDQESEFEIRVHFADSDALAKFAALIGQPLTERTRSIWYPKAERVLTDAIRYIDE